MKCIKTFAIIFLGWGFFAPLEASLLAAPAVVYVDPSYAAGNSGGHAFGVDAFAKIQEGVNAVSPGGTVHIAPGIYNEQVVVNGKSVALKGAGDSTVIRPSGADILSSFYIYLENAPQFPGMRTAGIVMIRDVSSAGVIIQDLKVDGSNVTALPRGAERLSGVFYAESGGIIQNVTVQAIRTGGIDDRAYGIDINAINGPVSAEIIGNRITDYLSNGIRAVGRNLTVDIRDNTVAGPENFLQASPRTTNGIALVYGPGGRVSGNVIKHLHSPNDGWTSSGIIVYGDNFKPLAVEGNEVFDVDYGISMGNGANDAVIRGNYLHDNKTGVMLESGATNNSIVANTITKNLQGFQIHGGLNPNPTGQKPPGAGNAARENLIFENIYGVVSFDDTQFFDAKNNWWGSANPDFEKIIYGSVFYAPWWATKDGIVEELPEAEESLPPAPNQSPDGDGAGQAGGEAIALAEPEESTALFDVEARPGSLRQSDSEASAARESKAASEIKTGSANLVTRVAPGELLPISVKLVNFGGGRRVDVTIDYLVLNEKGDAVVREKETVAVETTASFIKILQIPRDTQPGRYTAESSITYQGQKVPATASYQFVVERKIAGMFVSQFLIYGAITVVVGIMGASASRLMKKKLRRGLFTPHEYREVAKEERIFYEITSDIIMQMRYRAGDKALEIAKSIDDLVIDENSGRVLEIRKSPAKIIALLILKYEKLLGEKISFAIRRPDEKIKERLSAVDKNLVVVRKYFE